jgi:hypothetical protein
LFANSEKMRALGDEAGTKPGPSPSISIPDGGSAEDAVQRMAFTMVATVLSEVCTYLQLQDAHTLTHTWIYIHSQ